MNIQAIYKSIFNEKNELKRRINVIEHRFSAIEKYMKHAEDIKVARKQKKLIPMEKLFHELNI